MGPHVVIVTIPCPGHLTPATLLTKFLLARNIPTTCFTTGMNYPTVNHNLQDHHRNEPIVFHPLITADEFVPPGKEITDNISWMQALPDEEMARRLQRRVERIGRSVRYIVSDLMAGWTQDVADRVGVERVVLYTMPANALLFSFGCIPSLLSPQVAPTQPPGTWNSMTITTHIFHDYMIRNTKRLQEASSILVNTFEPLEPEFLRLLRADLIDNPSKPASVKVRNILSIGPFIRATGAERVSHEEEEEEEEVKGVMEWLDGVVEEEKGSVVYVSFGSLLTVTEEQISELACGLENCGRRFLWVYRAPNAPQVLATTSGGGEDEVLDGLPAGFVERVKGRGKLIRGWAPQEKILAHEAVGGFLSHCGWNSTLEALWAGKPIAAWPLAVEQRLTARYLANDLRIAVEVRKNDEGLVPRSEVMRAISTLMDDQEMRTRFLEMHEQARSALQEGGSSRMNLQVFVDSLVKAEAAEEEESSASVRCCFWKTLLLVFRCRSRR